MADLGLLGGLAEGIKGGIQGYTNERDYMDKKRQEAESKALQKKMMDLTMFKEGITDNGAGFGKTDQQRQLEALGLQGKQADLGKTKAETTKYLAEAKAAGMKGLPDDLLAHAESASSLNESNKNYEAARAEGYKPEGTLQHGIQAFTKKTGLAGLLGKTGQAFGLVQGPEEQKAEQAKEEFITAAARGDEIKKNDPKFREITDKTYFEQYGDSNEVAQQKQIARNRLLNALQLKSKGADKLLPSGEQVGTKLAGMGLVNAKKASGLMGSLESSAQAGGLSPEDQQAGAWAKANPQDPRAKEIAKRLGM